MPHAGLPCTYVSSSTVMHKVFQVNGPEICAWAVFLYLPGVDFTMGSAGVKIIFELLEDR